MNMGRSRFCMALAGLLVTTGVVADSFTIDPSHTLPVFEVSHLGFSTQRGRFDRAAGKISLDQANRTGRVELTIAADSIDMGQTKWNEHMKSADFFNVAQFPEIRFTSDRLTFEGDRPVSAVGQLTLLGVTRPVTLSIARFTCGVNPILNKPLCAADVETTLRRSEFGMTKYLPGVGDEVTVKVPVEAFRD